MADNSVLVSTFLKSICSYQLWTLFLTSRSDRIWKKLWSPEKGTARATETAVVKWGETHTSSLSLAKLGSRWGDHRGDLQLPPPSGLG